MRGFNRVTIIGNLTRDPEVRYTVNKKSYARFTVAVSNRYRDANGEFQETSDYINVVAWSNNAEVAGKYLKKGSPVFVEGRIRTGSYDAKDGSGKRYTTDVWVDTLILLGSSSGGGFSSSSSRGQSSGMDPFSSGLPMSDDFGSSIGDRGFGGTEPMTDFADDRNSMSDPEGTGIPF